VKRLLFLLAVAPSLFAQPASVPRHHENVEVVVANIDVTVVDKDGTHVTGLRPEDFDVIVGGAAQKITNFSEIQESSIINSPTSTQPAADRSPAAVPAPPHRIVFVIDNVSLHPDARKRVFDSARRFLRSSLGPNDQAMIVTCANGMKLRLGFTNDREDIEAALTEIESDVASGGLRVREIDELREELLSMDSTELAIGVARQYASRKRREVMHTADVLKSVLAWLSAIPGKKALVLMTESMPAEPGIEAFNFINSKTSGHSYSGSGEEYAAHDIIESVTRAANTASTTIYPIYARGLSSIGNSLNSRNPNPVFGKYDDRSPRLLHQGMQPTLADAMTIDRDAFETTKGSLDNLAISTGGFATTGGENFDRVFTDIASDLGSYYSIGYKPGSGKQTIVVRMKNPAWTARARDSFTTRTDRERAVDLVTAALFDRNTGNQLGIALHFGEKTIEGKKTHVPLSIRIPVENLTLVDHAARFDIHLRVADQSGGLSQIADATREIKVSDEDLAQIAGKYYTFQVDLVADQAALRVAASVTDLNAATTSVAVQNVK